MVVRDHVADLVRNHPRQLVAVLRHLEDAGVDADLAARQGEGVGFGSSNRATSQFSRCQSGGNWRAELATTQRT